MNIVININLKFTLLLLKGSPLFFVSVKFFKKLFGFENLFFDVLLFPKSPFSHNKKTFSTQ